jgi:hypothetical protein
LPTSSAKVSEPRASARNATIEVSAKAAATPLFGRRFQPYDAAFLRGVFVAAAREKRMPHCSGAKAGSPLLQGLFANMVEPRNL